MLKRKGYRSFDSFEPAKTGEPYFEYGGVNYIMTRQAKEAPNPDYTDPNHFREIIKGFSAFHKAASFGELREFSDFCGKNTTESFKAQELRLKKLKRLVYRKKRLDDIDYMFLKNYEYYYRLTREALEGLCGLGYDKEDAEAFRQGTMAVNNADEETMLLYPDGLYFTELLKLTIAPRLEDLRLIINRYLKKCFKPEISVCEIVRLYSEKNPLTERQLKLLYYLLLFPERYIKTYSDYYQKGHVFTPVYVKEAVNKIVAEQEKNYIYISELRIYYC